MASIIFSINATAVFGGSMRSRVVIFLVLGVSAVFGLLFMRELIRNKGLDREQFVEKKMRLLTYSTFVTATGPGPELIQKFQAACKCKVDVTTVSDAGILLERLKIGLGGAHFDVVVGLDQLMLDQARKDFAWRELDTEGTNWRPEIEAFAKSAEFVPLDWSPLTFVYRKSDLPVPEKFAELLEPQYRKQILLQDPRASSPGLQFYNWTRTLNGAKNPEFLKDLKANVQSISPSWAFAYGQFKKEQGRFVFSYLTSLAFHWGTENDRKYQVLSFPEGHPVQVEYVAVPAQCRQCELAVQFVDMLLQPENQRVIMQKNFMLPVLMGVEKDSIYSELPELKTIQIESGKDLRDWDQVFSR